MATSGCTSILQGLLSSLKPHNACVLCSEIIKTYDQGMITKQFCDPCFKDLPSIKNACRICGISLANSNLCGSCLDQPPFYDVSCIPLKYEFPIDNLVKQLKYKDKQLFSATLSSLIYDKIIKYDQGLPECIIPVPLHPLRLIQRGYNQSQLIAEQLAKKTNIPCDLHFCKRVKHTLKQAGMSKKQRQTNIRSAFVLDKSIGYNHVAILDDVVTTGSTVNEIARMMKAHGISRVEVWAIARAELH